MTSLAIGWHVCRALSLQGALILLVVGPLAGRCRAADEQATPTAERLVRDALEAEVAGDAPRRAALLEEATRIAPNYSLARWHSGQIEWDDAWLSVEDAQRAAAADDRLAEYQRLRDQVGDSPAGQLELARWCRRNNLVDEARLHWASVLSVDPNHEEAQRALGVRPFQGRLMTFAQIDDAKRRMKASREAAKRWAPRIAKWQRDITAEPSVRLEALEEIRAVSDVHAIDALEEATMDADLSTDLKTVRSRQFSLAAIEALDAMPDQAATDSLVRHAVLAPLEEVRSAAIDALKRRPLHDYVPLLLSGLAMPIESWFSITTDPDGSVHYQHSLYRERQHGDWSLDAGRVVWQHDFGGRRTIVDREGKLLGIAPPRVSDRQVAAKKAQVTLRYNRRYASSAQAVEQRVAHANRTAAEQNELILPVLAGATGQDLGNNPIAWWDWWRDYNEYDEPDGEPVYEGYYTRDGSYAYRPPTREVYIPPPPRGQYSCFARGTLVWTKMGRRPIESLEIGDLVLAQNPDTGELAYKPIVGRTVRPPSDIVNMKLDEAGQQEELHTTLGHPLWVAGVGWRMAKELGDGAVLHGVAGPVKVAALAPAEKAEAYNLVVADFNTYFVGQSGVLVHDNTPRAPTRAVVPGLINEADPAADVAASR